MKFIVLYITLFSIFSTILICMFASSPWLEKQIETEYRSVENVLGLPARKVMNEETERWYTWLFKDTGIEQMSYKMFVPKTQPGPRDSFAAPTARYLTPYAGPSVDRFWMQVYQNLQRIALFKLWFILCLPFVFAAFYDGVVTRKIKRYTFGFSSPWRYRLAFFSVEVIMLVLYMYLSLPISFDATAWVPLFWFTAISLAAVSMAANFTKHM